MERNENEEGLWYLKSTKPVLFPAHPALTLNDKDFDDFIRNELARRHESTEKVSASNAADTAMSEGDKDTLAESFTEVAPSTTADVRQVLQGMDMDMDDPDAKVGVGAASTKKEEKQDESTGNPFMDGLLASTKDQPAGMPNMENKVLTANGDVANQSTTNPLVDLFADLKATAHGPYVRQMLESAWSRDPLATLKIIFNARSIHLGKGDRRVFYRSIGWLAHNHPLTLVANLRWLSRPVIPKKMKKEEDDGGDDIELVEKVKADDDASRYDVKDGVAHGYWKDLLNILAIAANGKLNVLCEPLDVLTTKLRHGNGPQAGMKRGTPRGTPRGRVENARKEADDLKYKGEEETETSSSSDAHTAKVARRHERQVRQANATKLFHQDPVYRTLHLVIARLFAEQLASDLAALRGSDHRAKRYISLCGKWAPSADHFHDKHTLVVSSIAEILYPRDSFDGVLSATDSRETYLRHARERYRQDMSALRKHLDVVERDITAQAFGQIKYDRVPSIAMNNYTKLFVAKDMERFEGYLDRVASGKASISGATLLPSVMVKQAMGTYQAELSDQQKKAMKPADLVKYKTQALQNRAVDGQWNSLVQRIRDSGNLSSCMAVCDVSASMTWTTLADGTEPIHSAIGLSLLIASVTEQPFGGAYISFHNDPHVHRVDTSKSFGEQIEEIRKAPVGGSTNFVATFEKCILPLARKHKVKQEDMIKRIFVFSDMHFNQADGRSYGKDDERWTSSFERVKKQYAKYGYEVPELVFWNLAAGSGPTPKPVTTEDQGTALVSGYSQGMLKVFLDSGGFGDEEEEEQVVITKDEDGDVTEKVVKAPIDPLSTVNKAIGHDAYSMLQVLD